MNKPVGKIGLKLLCSFMIWRRATSADAWRVIAEDSSFRRASGEFTSGLSSRFRLVVIVNAHTDLRYLSLYTFVRPTGSRNDIIRTLWSVRNSNTFHLWTPLYKLEKLITVKKISRLFRRLAEIGLDKKKKENEPDNCPHRLAVIAPLIADSSVWAFRDW